MKVDAPARRIREAGHAELLGGEKPALKQGDVITSETVNRSKSFVALRAEVGSMPIGSKVTRPAA